MSDSDNNMIDSFLEVLSSDDDLAILGASSEEVIELALEEQFKNRRIAPRKLDNIIEMITEKFKFVEKFYSDDPEIIKEIRDRKNKIIIRLKKFFKDNLNIVIDIEDREIEDLFFTMDTLYRFFILNYKKNFINLFMNIILENLTKFSELSQPLNNDIQNFALKKRKIDKKYMKIISNIDEIIEIVEENYLKDVNRIVKTIIKVDPNEIISFNMKECFFPKKGMPKCFFDNNEKDNEEIILMPLKRDREHLKNELVYKLIHFSSKEN